MPWSAMLHAEATGAWGLALRDKFAITTIPALVLLNGEGAVLCQNAHDGCETTHWKTLPLAEPPGRPTHPTGRF
jgi:hypothetical protein